jgi:PAS domain S-box-containing protein
MVESEKAYPQTLDSAPTVNVRPERSRPPRDWRSELREQGLGDEVPAPLLDRMVALLESQEAELIAEGERAAAACAHSQTMRWINQELNRVTTSEEQLMVLSEPARKAGAEMAHLLYIDSDQEGEPEWCYKVASWTRDGIVALPLGAHLRLADFSATSYIKAQPDKVHLFPDVSSDPWLDHRGRALLLRGRIRTLALVPLYRPHRWIGFILFGWAAPHTFEDAEIEIYRALITRASSAIENRRLLMRAQKSLDEVQRSRALLQSIIDATPDWIFIKDLNHRFRMVNRSYAEAFHRTPADFVGKDNLEMGWPEDLVKGDSQRGIRGIWADDREVMARGEMISIPHDLVSVNGVLRVFDTIKIPLKDVQGQVWGLLGFARDRTELRQAEEELENYRNQLEKQVEERTAQLRAANAQLLWQVQERGRAESVIRENERFLEAVFDGIQDGISVLDADLTIVRVNRAMEKWYCHAMPLVGKRCFEAYHLRSEPCEVCPTRRARITELPQMDQIARTGESGAEGWLEVYAFPMRSETGEITGVIEYVRDISERKKMEEYVLRTERLAAMGRMAAALAHEINNPLHGIKNSLELVLDFPLGEERRQEYLHAVRREMERLTTLSHRILDFARPPRLEAYPSHVGEAVGYALTLAAKQLEHSRIQVALELPPDLAPVMASRDHLAQVFLNLILNSIAEMPNGGRLHISGKQIQDRIELAFRDEGQGIGPDDLPLIFEPFYTTREDGTGLGLSISYAIVQQYGGILSAENAPEGGAIFTVMLPVACGDLVGEQRADS